MKGKKVLLIIIIFLFILLIGACGVYAYFKTDIFKSPEQLFSKYLLNNFDQIKEFGKEPFDAIATRSKTENTKAVLDLGYSMGEEEENLTSYDLSLTTTNDVANKLAGLDLNITSDSNYIFKGNLIAGNNSIGLHVDDFSDKDYYVIENRDLKSLAKAFGMSDETIESIPDSVEEISNSTVATEKSNELNEIINTYLNKAYGELTVKDYSTEKATVEVFENNLDAKKVSLKLDAKEFSKVVLTNMKEFISDEKVKTLLKDDLTEEKIKELQENIDKSLTDIENESLPEGATNDIIISVYIYQGKTVKTEVNAMSKSFMEFTILDKQMKVVYDEKDESNEVSIKNTITIKNNYVDSEGSGDIEITYLDKDNKEVKAIIGVNKTSDNAYKFSAKVSSTDENMSSTIKGIKKLTYTIEFGTETKLLDTLSSGLIINDYTSDDVNKLFTDVGSYMQTFTQENNSSLIGTLLLGLSTFGDNATVSTNNLDENNDINTSASSNISSSTTPIVDINTTQDESGDDVIEDISLNVKNSINGCLDKYKEAALEDSNANIGDYLNIDNIQSQCDEKYKLELVDGSTIRVELQDDGKTYTASISYNEDLSVKTVDVVEN